MADFGAKAGIAAAPVIFRPRLPDRRVNYPAVYADCGSVILCALIDPDLNKTDLLGFKPFRGRPGRVTSRHGDGGIRLVFNQPQ